MGIYCWRESLRVEEHYAMGVEGLGSSVTSNDECRIVGRVRTRWRGSGVCLEAFPLICGLVEVEVCAE